MDMTAAPPKDVTGEKPAAGFFGSRAWRIIRNGLVGIFATLFIIWLVLFITKGRFLKQPFESVTTGSWEEIPGRREEDPPALGAIPNGPGPELHRSRERNEPYGTTSPCWVTSRPSTSSWVEGRRPTSALTM